MTINIGSQNKVKVDAVREILKDYPHLAHAEVIGVEARSDVSSQPKSLEETMQGAMNRARHAYHECDYAIGLESGLIHVLLSKTGYMDVCIAAIYDGREFHFGMSSGWEFPDKRVLDLILHEGLTMSEAINRIGMTKRATIGSEEGAIGILTKGRVTRKEYTKQALRMALIHLETFDEFVPKKEFGVE